MRAFSSGGGIQSIAALVLSAQGVIDFPTHLFCNVGDDSEEPETLVYLRTIAMPYAKANGIELIEIARATRDGETLLARTRREERSIKIPVRMGNGAPGARSCTEDFKRVVIRQWLGKGKHVVGLGISFDEAIYRMRDDSGQPNIVNEYPLVDLRLSRQACANIISKAGLPEPPKSACWFCPFHTMTAWRTMRARRPEMFKRAVELEQELIAKRQALGRDPVYLSRAGTTLDLAVSDQMAFDEGDSCASGYCMV